MTIEDSLNPPAYHSQDTGHFGHHVNSPPQITETDCDSPFVCEGPIRDQNSSANPHADICSSQSSEGLQCHEEEVNGKIKANSENSIHSNQQNQEQIASSEENCDTVVSRKKRHRDQKMSEKSDNRKYMTLRSSPQVQPSNSNGRIPDIPQTSNEDHEDGNSNDKKIQKVKVTAKVGRPKSKEKLETKEADKSNNTQTVSIIKRKRKIDSDSENEVRPSCSKKRKCVKNAKETEIKTENECPICLKVFPECHSFTLHIREHNSSPHTCEICQKNLSSASSLDRHMYVHSGERPFRCTICHIAFTTNGNMHRHMRIHRDRVSGLVKFKREMRKIKKSLFHRRKRISSPTSSEKSPDTSLDTKYTLHQSNDLQIKHSQGTKESQTSNCPVCGKIFYSSSDMDLHMNTHPNNPIKCQKCGILSDDYDAYRHHVCADSKKITTPDNQESCVVGFRDLNYIDFSSSKFSLIAKTVCEKESRRPSSAFHAFECHTCGKAFPCKRTLRRHEIIHNEKSETFCHTCKCSFLSPAYLSTHKLKHRLAEHCNTVNSTVEQSSESKKEDFFALLELHNKKDILKRNEMTDTNEENFENSTYSTHEKFNDLNNENQVDTSNDFAEISAIISLASKTPFMPDMRASPVTAAPASPPKDTITLMPNSPVIEGSANACSDIPSVEDQCELSCENSKCNVKDLSNSHDENTDGNDHPVSLQHAISLKQQSRSHGQNNSSFSCEVCSYKSTDKSTLMRHLRTHNGERPFQCKICRYAFTTKANSQRHVKKKHQIPPEEIHNVIQYNPDMSDMKNPENLQNENGNSETVCKYCNKDFKFNRVLRHHLRSLNNSCSQKPFSCAECRLGFSTKNNCIRHISNQHPEKKDRFKELVIINSTSDTSDQEYQQNVNGSSAKESKQNEVSTTSLMPSNTNHDTNDSYFLLEPLNLNIINEEKENNDKCTSSFEDDSENSHAEKVSIAQSLVSLSEALVPQEMPLDLSVSALDLSLKCDSPTSLSCDTKYASVERLHSSFNMPPEAFPTTLLKLNIPSEPPIIPNIFIQGSMSPLNLSSIISVPEPINLVRGVISQTLHEGLLRDKQNSPSRVLSHISATSLPDGLIRDISSNNTSKNDEAPCNPNLLSDNLTSSQPEEICTKKFKLVKEKLTDNQKLYTCNYCASKFTLKSNKERHIKRKHPQFARPTRSRNFIPTLSPTSIQKQPVSTLSNKTRDALRTVLSSKANTNVSQRQDDKISGADNFTSDVISSNGCSGNIYIKKISTNNELSHISVAEMQNEKDHKIVGDNADLASVSDVIDTANSPVFKRYLTEDDFEINPKRLHLTYELAESASSKEVKIENNVADAIYFNNSRRKSSYTKSPNTVACSYCNRKFPWRSSLRRHVLTHTGQKPYKCSKCPIHFTTKSNMDRHLERKHPTIAKKSRKNFYLRHRAKPIFNKNVELENKIKKSENTDVKSELEDLTSEDFNAEKEHDRTVSQCKEFDQPNDGFSDDSCEKDIFQDHTLVIDQDIVLHQDAEGNIVKNEFVKEEGNPNEEPKFSVLKLNDLSNDHDSVSKVQVPKVMSIPQDKSCCMCNCCFCLEKFGANDELLKHIGEQHSDNFPSTCLICHLKLIDIKSMLGHQKTHLKDKTLENGVNNDDKHSKECGQLKQASHDSFVSTPAVDKITHSRISLVQVEKKLFSALPNGKQLCVQDESDKCDLIENLLGIKDSKIVDEMLDNAAANLLKLNNT